MEEERESTSGSEKAEKPQTERSVARETCERQRQRQAYLRQTWGEEPWQKDWELIDTNVATCILGKKGKLLRGNSLGEVSATQQFCKLEPMFDS
jgi:hypothetical protein